MSEPALSLHLMGEPALSLHLMSEPALSLHLMGEPALSLWLRESQSSLRTCLASARVRLGSRAAWRGSPLRAAPLRAVGPVTHREREREGEREGGRDPVTHQAHAAVPRGGRGRPARHTSRLERRVCLRGRQKRKSLGSQERHSDGFLSRRARLQCPPRRTRSRLPLGAALSECSCRRSVYSLTQTRRGHRVSASPSGASQGASL